MVDYLLQIQSLAPRHYNRVENMAASDVLKGHHVVVTGVGYQQRKHVFWRKEGDRTTKAIPTHDSILVDGIEMKLNIGAATASVLTRAGASVTMVSRSKEKLEHIQNYLHGYGLARENAVHTAVIDALNKRSVENLVQQIDSYKHQSHHHWVHCVGLSAGTLDMDSHPYQRLRETLLSRLRAETDVSVTATHLLMQHLLPLLTYSVQKQHANSDGSASRIVIVTSMSAIRGYHRGAAHCAAKGALDRYANSAMLDLYSDNIYLTTVRPGAVDTGMYDDLETQAAALDVDTRFGGVWQAQGRMTLMPPTAVAQSILLALTAPAHIPSINLVAQGQFPHEGS